MHRICELGETYFWVDICDTWTLLRVMADVDFVVSVVVLADEDVVWGSSLSDNRHGGCLLLGILSLPLDAYIKPKCKFTVFICV